MGLGCGGHSRLGRRAGGSRQQAVDVVKRAFDLGVNLVDTAGAYGTEEIVAQALKSRPRDSIIVSTKAKPWSGEKLITAAELERAAEESLKQLDVDYIDIFHLHAVEEHYYHHVREELAPALLRLREQGKIRFLGITEEFTYDPQHRMLERALADNCWDVMMVGFNLLNQSARTTVFPQTQSQDIGVLVMFAVRRALRSQANFQDTIALLQGQGHLPPDCSAKALCERLQTEGQAHSLQDAAYRFCRYQPGVHVVLSGTGSIEHLEDNARSLQRPPLAPAAVRHLHTVFGGIDCIAGN